MASILPLIRGHHERLDGPAIPTASRATRSRCPCAA
jgi:hypothetical protein